MFFCLYSLPNGRFLLKLHSYNWATMKKPTKWHVCPSKTQISLGIRLVWSESSLSAWQSTEPLATHWVHSEGSDQTVLMPMLIWAFAGCIDHYAPKFVCVSDTLFDACHILRTVHARVLKFHVWIPHGKIADPWVFFCPSCLPFWSYASLKKSEWNLVSKISQKSIWTRGLKLGQLIGNDE